jgi:predicted short-subunit dehydrogenase-like oxidoreductase (DUF2520 family)
MNVAVIGAGRVGTAVAVLLRQVGHTIVGVTGRSATRDRVARFLPGVPLLGADEAASLADLVVLATPDDLLAPTVIDLVDASVLHPGAWVAHLSGATGLDVLTPASAAGARRLAIHPLQTFPDVERALAELPGSTVAVTADDERGFELGESLARDLGAEPFRLADALRPLYHAAAVFASNDVVAISGIAARLFAVAGIPDPASAMHPLQRATIANVGRLGPGAALTGPAVRGDAGTVAKNLQALEVHAPDTIAAYVVLCRAALDLAVDAGRLDPERRASVDEVLAHWS